MSDAAALRTNLLDWGLRCDRPGMLTTEQVVQVGTIITAAPDNVLHWQMKQWAKQNRPPPAFISDPDKAGMWNQLERLLERKQTP